MRTSVSPLATSLFLLLGCASDDDAPGRLIQPAGYPEPDDPAGCAIAGTVVAEAPWIWQTLRVDDAIFARHDDWVGNDDQIVRLGGEAPEIVHSGYATRLSFRAGDWIHYSEGQVYDEVTGYRLNARTGVLEPSGVDGKVVDATHDGRDVWFMTWTDGSISEVELRRRPLLGGETKVLATYEAGDHILADPSNVWIFDNQPDADMPLLWRVDPRTAERKVVLRAEDVAPGALWVNTNQVFHDADAIYWIGYGRVPDDSVSLVVRVSKRDWSVTHLVEELGFNREWERYYVAADATALYAIQRGQFGDCGDGDGCDERCCPPGETWILRVDKTTGEATELAHLPVKVPHLEVDAACLYLIDGGEYYTETPLRAIRALAKR